MQKITDSMPASLTETETDTDLKLAYTVISGRYGSRDLLPYTSYGVEIRLNRSGQPEETARVEDITTCRAEAEKLLERLRRNRVTPVTLGDVIEDSLGVCIG